MSFWKIFERNVDFAEASEKTCKYIYFNKGHPPALAASKLSTWRMIYVWALTSLPEFQSYIIFKKLRCEWFSGS